jgi:hypothetical protein
VGVRVCQPSKARPDVVLEGQTVGVRTSRPLSNEAVSMAEMRGKGIHSMIEAIARWRTRSREETSKDHAVTAKNMQLIMREVD